MCKPDDIMDAGREEEEGKEEEEDGDASAGTLEGEERGESGLGASISTQFIPSCFF
jgi:hypothetical protein